MDFSWNNKDNLSNMSGMDSSLGFSGLKRPGDNLIRRTPSKTPRKSPGRTPGTPGTTPGRKTGDRFIPNRSAMDFENAYHKLFRENPNDSEVEMQSPSKREYTRVLQGNLNIADPNTSRVLAFNPKVSPSNRYLDSLKILSNSQREAAAQKQTVRLIPQSADRILDAPDIIDDYYLNLVDWSQSNQLAVALGSTAFIWNADNGAITPLLEAADGEYICSVRWISDGGHHLAVGTSDGLVQLWDVAAGKRLRVMTGHDSRVSSLAWNQYILSSGSRSGSILHSDVRVPTHLVSASYVHTQEVCGLAWSPDGRYLASGGNDNLVCVWNAAQGECFAGQAPHLTITDHQAAVRAVAWCPWQSGVLASGGGARDKTIKIWNCNTGRNITSLDTKSQVCSLLWNENYNELASSHGYPSHEINIWKYPTMKKVGELTGHTRRVLHLSLSPDTSTLLSAGADETLRLWNLFPLTQKKKEAKTRQPMSSLFMNMR